MAKGLFGGMTDYNHQSFTDILNDLEEERIRIESYREKIQSDITQLQVSGYWNDKVPNSFKGIVSYAMRHFSTTISELYDIQKDLLKEVKEHHIKRLQKIASVAQEININIGKVWHQQYNNKEYGRDEFNTVETIYADTRDMAVNLLDASNIAERLHDFVGKTELQSPKKRWERGHKIALGSFLVGTIVLFFGNNLYDRFIKSSPTSTILSQSAVGQLHNDTILVENELPYLENYPIIDKGLYVKYYYNDFLLGGVNVDSIQLNARTISSEALDLKKDNDYLSMDITREPYIEFKYKGKFYSIELKGSHYKFVMTLKEIVKPTMTLRNM